VAALSIDAIARLVSISSDLMLTPAKEGGCFICVCLSVSLSVCPLSARLLKVMSTFIEAQSVGLTVLMAKRVAIQHFGKDSLFTTATLADSQEQNTVLGGRLNSPSAFKLIIITGHCTDRDGRCLVYRLTNRHAPGYVHVLEPGLENLDVLIFFKVFMF